MKVGDLVKLKPYCKNKDRLAIIIIVPEYLKTVRIMYLDNGKESIARMANLEVISECG